MKIQKKNRQDQTLRKTNDRWRWMAGATAASAAAATASQGAVVQINLIGNSLFFESNALDADLTGNGQNIVDFTNSTAKGGGEDSMQYVFAKVSIDKIFVLERTLLLWPIMWILARTAPALVRREP